MKDIDDIIFDSKWDTLYAENSDGSGSSSGWEYKEVVGMMKEYAVEVLDEVWKGYDLALSTEDQQMMDNILDRVKQQL